jgi:hypothetical protein
MVEQYLAKVWTGVRFPLAAPNKNIRLYVGCFYLIRISWDLSLERSETPTSEGPSRLAAPQKISISIGVFLIIKETGTKAINRV